MRATMTVCQLALSRPDQGYRPGTELVTKIKVSLSTGFVYQQGFSCLAGRLAKLPP
jgi:hypothetical protein